MTILFDSIANLGTELVKRLITDPTQQSEALYKLEELKQTGELAQMQSIQAILTAQLEVAKVEAGSDDRFITRPRAFVMWVCAGGFAYAFLLRPLLVAAGVAAESLPTPDLTMAFKILLGMLGIAG